MNKKNPHDILTSKTPSTIFAQHNKSEFLILKSKIKPICIQNT